MQRGEAHYSVSNRLIEAKTFNAQILCPCRLKCHLRIDVATQREYFNHYYRLRKWSNKTRFLRSLVKRLPIKENQNLEPKINLKQRNFVSKYYLIDENNVRQQVCSSFLVKLLKINRVTLFRASRSVESNPAASERRGKYPTKKTDARDIFFLKTFIQSFATFDPHHGIKYLHPQLLSVEKLYAIYSDKCSFQNRTLLSKALFRRIFKRDFKLAFVKRKKTCKECKQLAERENVIILSKNMKKTIQRKRKSHVKKVKTIKKDFVRCVEQAADDSSGLEVFTVGLQRAQQIPYICEGEADKVFQLRPLWCFNLCIFDEKRQRGSMYVWDETIAAKGFDEIGSCLLKHLSSHVPENANKVVIFSNKRIGIDIEIAMMLDHFLNKCAHPELQSIEQTFFVTGHDTSSYSRCFDYISKAMKTAENMYIPDHWYDFISQAKKNEPRFTVVKMQREDFFRSKSIEEQSASPRKKIVDRKAKYWQKFPNIIYDHENNCVSMQNNYDNSTSQPDIKLTHLSEKSCDISNEKFNDLSQMLKYIPTEYHDFYNSLKHENVAHEKDYMLASSESSEFDDED